MESPGQSARVVLVGDPGDPLYHAIDESIIEPTRRLDCVQGLADAWPDLARTAEVVVVHLPVPSERDLANLVRLRSKELGTPRLILCVGLIARYHQLHRWAMVCDAVLAEATAPDVIGRFLKQDAELSVAGPRDGNRPCMVAVVSGEFELRAMLADACQRAGFAARPARDWDTVSPSALAVWDVPVLEQGWEVDLRRESRQRRVVALAGFCDRDLVSRMRANGAHACLDLPCDPDDLAWVLSRLAGLNEVAHLVHSPHVLPPSPALAKTSEQVPASALRGLTGRSHLE